MMDRDSFMLGMITGFVMAVILWMIFLASTSENLCYENTLYSKRDAAWVSEGSKCLPLGTQNE